jgi:hypothetical protein
MMSRAVAGLPCRLRIPVRHYHAVAVLSRDCSHVIRLVHSDDALSVDVEEFRSLGTAEEYRDRLADFLSLPPLTLAGGAFRTEHRDAPQSRRSRAGLRARRPRFLARRTTGRVTLEKVAGREIIARH